jgi:hypothetical protein
VSGRLNVVKGLKRTNQIARFGRSPHLISLERVPVRIYLARGHSIATLEYFDNTSLYESSKTALLAVPTLNVTSSLIQPNCFGDSYFFWKVLVNKLFKPLNGRGMTSMVEAGTHRFTSTRGVHSTIGWTTICITWNEDRRAMG